MLFVYGGWLLCMYAYYLLSPRLPMDRSVSASALGFLSKNPDGNPETNVTSMSCLSWCLRVEQQVRLVPFRWCNRYPPHSMLSWKMLSVAITNATIIVIIMCGRNLLRQPSIHVGKEEWWYSVSWFGIIAYVYYICQKADTSIEWIWICVCYDFIWNDRKSTCDWSRL